MKLITFFVVALLLATASPMNAQNLTQDQQEHCKNLMEQARGAADQLRVPSLLAGGTQPSAGTPAQAFVGVQNSIAGDRKAADTILLAARTCSLYNSTEDVALRIFYALPALQKDALEHRAAIINVAESKLSDLITDAQTKVSAQDLPRPTLYTLQTSKVKFALDKASTQETASLIYVPDGLNNAPIKQLLADKQGDEIATQKAIEKLASASNWDVALEAGAHHQLSSSNPAMLNTTLTFGLGSRAANKHFDKAATAYTDWKQIQEGDAIRNAAILKQQLTDNIQMLERSRAVQREEEASIEENLDSVKDVETSSALAFTMQLKADQLLLRVEVEDTDYRLEMFKQYLLDNF
jgi:hypothetical protein